MLNGMKVEVLGTSFNVNSYADENYTEVTLVEGHVAAYVDDKNYDLLPSRQLRWDKENESVDVRTVNVNDYIAWKKGQYGLWKRSLKCWSVGTTWKSSLRVKKARRRFTRG